MMHKNVAKFLSGFATATLLHHLVFYASDILPLHLFGMTLTNATNTIAIFGWTIVLIASVHVAWIRK